MESPLIKVLNLKKHYPLKKVKLFESPGSVKALNGVSFSIRKGETFGLVGESGSGKSTAGHTIARLFEATEGKIIYKNRDITRLKGKSLKELRKEIQIVFQDTYGSLNPKKTIEWILKEPLKAHGLERKMDENIREYLEMVGLDETYLKRYPHELSGGQRQRIGILSALILKPEFIVADEPVSALDVSVQAQILNLLKGLQNRLGLTYLFISHDLNVVHYLCDKIGVMYLGEIVESAGSGELYKNPLHPYTQALLSAIPGESGLNCGRIILQGDAPNPTNPPPGCHFHPRCFKKMDICSKIPPGEIEISDGHRVKCHLYYGK